MLIQRNNESDQLISNMYTKEFVAGIISKAFVRDQIEKDIPSLKKKKMKQGVAYYNEIQDILKAKANVVDIGGQAISIVGKSNIRAVHNFHTLLVDQKKDYLVGNQIKFSYDESISEEHQKQIKLMLRTEFHKNMQLLVLGASNKSEEWTHYFINEKGEFDWVVIPAEQIIPFYDGKYDRELVGIIRYYNVEVTDVETSKTRNVKRAEVWTKDDVTYYIQTAGNSYEPDPDEILNPRPHVILGDFLESDREQLMSDEKFSWDVVPFIPVYNNTAKKTDLQPIKSLIDLYDQLIATGANTIIDLQEALWEVKGYEGDDITELSQKLKQFKVVNLDADKNAGIKGHQLDIPWEARKDLIEKTKDAIYEQGRGVNTNSDNFRS
ncbi:MAG: phage portal protein, partial [Promethearchaeota archaeon]